MFVKRCPKCNGFIVERNKATTEEWEDYIIIKHYGVCHECGASYTWDSYYKWSFDEEPEEKEK